MPKPPKTLPEPRRSTKLSRSQKRNLHFGVRGQRATCFGHFPADDKGQRLHSATEIFHGSFTVTTLNSHKRMQRRKLKTMKYAVFPLRKREMQRRDNGRKSVVFNP
jgi:hypothetical protein